MISAQTLRVYREGRPLHTFPDHALETAGVLPYFYGGEFSYMANPV
jgi:hypothetical protein